MKIDVLRQATALDHRRVEAAFPMMSEQMDTSMCLRCLQALHGLIAAWEEESLRAAPEGLRAMIRSRSRLALLDADLAWYGVAATAGEQPAMPSLTTTAKLLGAMYVMEGSALGGRLIARHLEQVLKLTPGCGNAYFRGFEERTGALWLEFSKVLERTVDDRDSEEAIASAKEMFAVFEAWMLQARVATEQTSRVRD